MYKIVVLPVKRIVLSRFRCRQVVGSSSPQVMLHETIRNDDFQHNSNAMLYPFETVSLLQCCVVLKIVVANRLVPHHLNDVYDRLSLPASVSCCSHYPG